MTPMTNADETPTNRLMLFPIYLSLFIVSTLCLHVVVQIGYHEKGTKEKMFPDYTNTDVALWDGERDNIRLPASVFSIGELSAP